MGLDVSGERGLLAEERYLVAGTHGLADVFRRESGGLRTVGVHISGHLVAVFLRWGIRCCSIVRAPFVMRQRHI